MWYFILVFYSLILFGEENMSFNDSFSASVNQIISRSIDVSLSELTLDYTESVNIPTQLTFLPTLSFVSRMPITNNINSTRSLELSSQWNLFRWGADYYGWQAGIFNEEAKNFDIQQSILTVEQTAVQALIIYIQKIKEVEIYQNIAASQKDMLDIAQKRYSSGRLPIQEVEKITVDYSNSAASLADSQVSQKTAQAQLKKLLGHTDVIFEWPWLDVLKKDQGKLILEKDLVLQQRPDWLSAQKNIQSQDEKLSQNWSLLFPTLDAYFSYGHYSRPWGSFTGATAELMLNVPLFDQLNNYSKAKAQAALKKTSEVQLEQIKRNAKSQWEAARENFQIAMQSAMSREKTLLLSQKLYQDNLQRFQAGRITVNDLAIDRMRVNSAELFVVQGWSSVHIYFSDLCHSLGYRVNACLKK